MQKHKESSPYTQLQGLIWLGLHLLQKHIAKRICVYLLLYFGFEMSPERTMGWRLSPYTVVSLGSCGTLTRWDPEDKISSLKICRLRVCWNPSPLLYTTLFPGCMNSIHFSAIHSSLIYGTLPWPQMHQGEITLHWNIWNCESNTPFLFISCCVSGIFIGTRSQLTHFQAPEGEQ